ncbi:hypothetical protein RND71_043528 [Anisodus tanguticus]|uniref:proteasome endopeptidase complex n=1 Tax=Anisodus tanguticus TaxID=243964 RepID=A0AAE1UR77_9SOLA|nr:hypothetical protein RND71_043528 [Anisodus tanguticus]
MSKSRKSILDLDLTAYDLVEEPEQTVNEKSNNLNNSFEDEEDHFENMFLQAKAKQIQHLYKPTNEKTDSKKDDTWLANEKKNLSCLRNNKKFNSCRIAGQGMQLFGKTSLSNIEESKNFFKEENSEEEDLNRFDKYAKNFDQLDKTERFINKNIFSSQNSIPNVPAPDYDLDEEQDKSVINIFSRSTSDLDQVKEEENLKKTFSNSTKIFVKSDNSLRIKNQDRLSLPPPPPPPLPNLNKKFIKTNDTNSPTSSTYSSFNLSINNSNVKSILKKSNSNLILIDNSDLIERKVKKPEYINQNLIKAGLPVPNARKTGTTICGIIYKDGVILGADTRATMGNIIAEITSEKIHYIADHIRCCGAGTAADTEKVTTMFSSQLELHRLLTGKKVPIIAAIKLIQKHLFQYQGYVGAALILGGVDENGPRISSIHPHGSIDTLPYTAMGSGCLAAIAVLEKDWRPNLEVGFGNNIYA